MTTDILKENLKQTESSVDLDKPFSSDDSIADPNFSPQRHVLATNLLNDSQTNNQQIKQSHKRKTNRDAWIKNVAKKARNCGKPYVSSSKTKKEFGPRKLAAPCDSQVCRLQCSSKISQADREKIFSDYWSLGDLQRQRDYLLACIETVAPKYRYTREGSNRRMNNAFYFIVRDTKYRPLLSEQIQQRIHDGGKSLSQLHRDYVDNCIQKGEPYANYLMFSRIFNYEYNIAFFSPKKDQCEDCMAFKVASDEEKISLKDDYENHLKEKELSRREKENDKNNSDEGTIVAVYDLQAVLQCPKGDVSTFYYTCKLNVFNLTVYEIKNILLNVSCGMSQRLTEGYAKLVLYFKVYTILRRKVATSPVDLIFYSDNCQQKNRFMFSMYLYAVQKFPQIKSITHKFLIKGHSQNEGDSVHSVIERSIKRSVKSGLFLLPNNT
nr:unnamed protein product [Callosobruchus analis]